MFGAPIWEASRRQEEMESSLEEDFSSAFNPFTCSSCSGDVNHPQLWHHGVYIQPCVSLCPEHRPALSKTPPPGPPEARLSSDHFTEVLFVLQISMQPSHLAYPQERPQDPHPVLLGLCPLDTAPGSPRGDKATILWLPITTAHTRVHGLRGAQDVTALGIQGLDHGEL